MKYFLRMLGRQTWVRFGIRDRLIGFFYNPNKVDTFDFEVDFFGARYNGNLNCYIDWVVYFYGAYEQQDLYLCRNIVKNVKEPVFLDIGANIGQHSLFMAKYCGQVHAFEPYAEVGKKLEQKITRNNIDNIVIHPVGLGDKNEELPYFAPQGANTGTGSFIRAHDLSNTECGTLSIVDADEYIANLKFEKIDLIKIDVVGYEKYVLLGLKNTIAKYRPTVMMEFSGAATKDSFSGIDELRSLFPEAYGIKKISTNRPCWVFFNSPQYKLVDFDGSGGRIVAVPDEATFLRVPEDNLHGATELFEG
jgi:FkbM family methyltransferase